MSRTVRRSAAALVYDAKGNDRAPRVIAKGYGLVAEMIIQRAREAGLYVHEAPEMVSLLMQVDLDARIPPQLYQAVAELLAWLHRLESGAADESPSTAVAVVSEASVAHAAASVDDGNANKGDNSADNGADDKTIDSDAF
jgi:flagellar biosynthesis protein